MAKKSIYRISFLNNNKIYELYAKEVGQSNIWGFIEISDFVFGKKGQVLLDPQEEHLKQEFSGVNRSYIPMHAVLRIDEVPKEGVAKIVDSTTDRDNKVTPFPMGLYDAGKKK